MKCGRCKTVFVAAAGDPPDPPAPSPELDINDLWDAVHTPVAVPPPRSNEPVIVEEYRGEADSLGQVATNIAEQYFTHLKEEQELKLKALLLQLVVVCVVLFFCCGLPMLMSVFDPPVK